MAVNFGCVATRVLLDVCCVGMMPSLTLWPPLAHVHAGALDFTLRLAALATEAARTAGFPLRSTADPQSGAGARARAFHWVCAFA